MKIFRTFRRDKSASPPTPTFTFPSVHMSLFSNLHWHFLRCCLSDRGKRKKGLSYMRRIDCYIAFVLSVVLFAGRLTGMDSPPCGIIIGVPWRNAVRRYSTSRQSGLMEVLKFLECYANVPNFIQVWQSLSPLIINGLQQGAIIHFKIRY